MKLISTYHTFVTACLLLLQCDCLTATLASQPIHASYEISSHISSKEKKAISPYLLPETSEIKSILDSLFSIQRVTHDIESVVNAGFKVLHLAQPRSFINVVSHPLIPGYLFKMYLDNELRLKQNAPGWKWISRRAKGAKRLSKYFEKKKIVHFTVPKKWIYPLPAKPAAIIDAFHVNINEILVVEDMQLVSTAENLEAWKTKITYEHLDELFDILLNNDCIGNSCRPDNIFYTNQGKFAFIDTENINEKTNFRYLQRYLSPEMANYWKFLIQNTY